MTKFMFFVFILVTSYLFPVTIYGQHFESNNYNIDWGNFNMTSGRKTSSNYSLTDTVGQNAPGEYTKTGYKLKSGFQYIYPFDEFSFEIDNLNIDFGTLTSNVASTATSILTITTPSGHGFQITTHENNSPKLDTGTTIPDVSGDNSLASEITPDLWQNANTYGFGFNANTTYFPTTNHFKQFANISQSKSPQIIDSSTTPIKDHETIITYKINISPIQASGTYQNYIVYTAIPNY